MTDAIRDSGTLLYQEEQPYTGRTLAKLGKAGETGLSAEECRESCGGICVKPASGNSTPEEIHAAYEKADKSKRE